MSFSSVHYRLNVGLRGLQSLGPWTKPKQCLESSQGLRLSFRDTLSPVPEQAPSQGSRTILSKLSPALARTSRYQAPCRRAAPCSLDPAFQRCLLAPPEGFAIKQESSHTTASHEVSIPSAYPHSEQRPSVVRFTSPNRLRLQVFSTS
jgi:hypothetical protein